MQKKRGRKMRLPNGFGSVVFLGEGRRNPYAAQTKTNGYNDKGHPVRKCIGYFPTWDDAYNALLEYNKNPYDLDLSKITFSNLFSMMMERKEKSPEGLSASNKKSLSTAYSHSESLWNIPIIKIKTYHLQNILDELSIKLKKPSLCAIKNLWVQMWTMAEEYDIVVKNYASFVKISQVIESEHHQAFTIADINFLWENVDKIFGIDLVLVLCYTGYRASAFENLKINLDEWYFQGGLKTASGKNRIVPIHSRIRPLVEKLIAEKRLFGVLYRLNRQEFDNTMKVLNMTDKTMHCCRSTFATMLEKADVKDLHIKRLMGHSSRDLTKDVYTKVEIEELRASIEKMP